ncbi:MAG TPA: PA2928 family protein [Pseudoxanthomonas sp.]
MSQPARKVLAALGVVLLILLGIAGLWVLQQGGGAGLRQVLTTGGFKQLQPALFQSAPLRTDQGGADRLYLLSTQSETITGAMSRRSANRVRRDLLHVDLWAIDARTATVAWRKRLRTYEGDERSGRDLRGFALLGADGKTLWLTVDGPLGVSLADGSVVADGARIDKANPAMAGKRVDEAGYIAFGRHGLQVTLNDASQWRIDASDLSAAPRDTDVRNPAGILPPAKSGSTSSFMTRALPIGERWLGVMTDQEAELYRNKPVIPGRDPNERPGVMQQFLEENHVPAPLLEPKPQQYRLWGARMVQVSAAPPDWPKQLPDRWGKRPKFSDYRVLPESPRFLRAGLLHEGMPHQSNSQEQALWYREPDSVLVLHSDKLGQQGRLQLTRVSGPLGKPVWTLALPMDQLRSVMRKDNDLMLLGSEPPAADKKSEEEGPHVKVARVEVAAGRITVLDLTAQSLL